MTGRQFVRVVVTYLTAGFTAAAAATITTLPFHRPWLGAVWLATVMVVGFATTVLADRITFRRTTSNGDRT